MHKLCLIFFAVMLLTPAVTGMQRACRAPVRRVNDDRAFLMKGKLSVPAFEIAIEHLSMHELDVIGDILDNDEQITRPSRSEHSDRLDVYGEENSTGRHKAREEKNLTPRQVTRLLRALVASKDREASMSGNCHKAPRKRHNLKRRQPSFKEMMYYDMSNVMPNVTAANPEDIGIPVGVF